VAGAFAVRAQKSRQQSWQTAQIIRQMTITLITNLFFAPLTGGPGTLKLIASVNVAKGDLDVAGWTTI